MNNSDNIPDIIAGYNQMVESYERKGWSGTLLTFTYNQMRGTRRTVLAEMQDEVERVYTLLLTRIIRDPRNPENRSILPFLLGVPDYPVHKHQKVLLKDFLVNGGLHIHAPMYVPPESRLKVGLDEHIADNREFYVSQSGRLAYLDATDIDRTPWKLVDYVFKSLKRGRISPEDIIILPKAASELEPASHIVRRGHG
jgi:hypothetical protein